MLDGARQHELITKYNLCLSHHYFNIQVFLGGGI